MLRQRIIHIQAIHQTASHLTATTVRSPRDATVLLAAQRRDGASCLAYRNAAGLVALPDIADRLPEACSLLPSVHYQPRPVTPDMLSKTLDVHP